MPALLIDRVKSTIAKYKMLQKNESVLAGLSGGPDSVALVKVLLMLKDEYMLDIHVAHLDHKFRGEESASDRRFCEDLAKKMKLDIVCEEIDVPEIAKGRGISSEEAAREVRYDFFRRVAGAKKIRKVAVGHTKDDQAETILMRMIRGAGMSGLGGMRAVNELHGLTVIRPLIELSRSDIKDFIREQDLQFRYDSSNDELMFTRNRVRQKLIPYLEKEFNPNIKEVLVNMGENLSIENEFLGKFAMRKFRGMARKNKSGEIVIDIKRFKRQHEALRKRILRCALEEAKGNLRRWTYRHWKEMDELIYRRPVNSIVDLPGGINFVKHRNSLILTRIVGNR